MGVRVTVEGIDRLTAKLRKLPRAIRTEVRTALAHSAAEIAAEARRDVRGARDPASAARFELVAASITARADGSLATVGSDAPEARHLEFGTLDTPAQPFLQPTFERLKPRIRKRLGDAVRAGLRKAIR